MKDTNVNGQSWLTVKITLQDDKHDLIDEYMQEFVKVMNDDTRSREEFVIGDTYERNSNANNFIANRNVCCRLKVGTHPVIHGAMIVVNEEKKCLELYATIVLRSRKEAEDTLKSIRKDEYLKQVKSVEILHWKEYSIPQAN